MAVADTYDALRSARPYKKAFSHKKAVEIIKEEGCAQFDPQVVAAFIRMEDKFRNLFIESSDE